MKRGIIIANTGTPASPDPADVAAYLERFLSNPRIVPMNPVVWRQVLRRFVLPKRSVASGKKYEHIWTDDGFQFVNDHFELARKLQAAYQADGEDVLVRMAMSFSEPFIPDAMDELVREGCEHITVLPLYPQNAFSQAYIVADEVFSHARKIRWQGELDVIGDYSGNSVYLHAMADAVRASGFSPERGDRLVMGYHSIPKIDVANGDTYEEMTKATSAWIACELQLPDDSWIMGYQCRFDKRRPWLEPYSHDILDKWWQEGFDGRIFYLCPNFSVDCLETYYDVEGVLKVVWLGRKLEAGMKIHEDSFVYIPCLGASDTHVNVLRDVIANPGNYIV